MAILVIAEHDNKALQPSTLNTISAAIELSEHGAELAFTYLGDALKKRVVPLAESLKSNFISTLVSSDIILGIFSKKPPPVI